MQPDSSPVIKDFEMMNQHQAIKKRLVGMSFITETFDCSRSTINRKRKVGKFPEPDIPASCSGESNKWLLETIEKVFDDLTGVSD